MAQYDYNGVATAPNLDGITDDVAASAMTDKNLEYCRWDQADEHLGVFWTGSLSGGDKTILDGIVAANL